MVRNFMKPKEEVPQAPQSEALQKQEEIQVVERVIDLNLINDKLNYITGILHKIAKACELDLSA